jgi:phospholipid/cholesterol/gamma-HCH transport system substrate-binding protein
MERNANYALVGVSALLLFAGILIFVVWLARFQFARDFDQYDVLFVGPVRGLNDGGEVHFNGIKVGEVTEIALDKVNSNRVIARIRVTSDVPIRTDSRATLEPMGITGVNYMQITAGGQDKPLLKTTVQRGEVPVILSQSNAISDLLAGGGTVLTRAIEALDRVSRVLSDDNIRNFTGTVRDVRGFSAELNARKSVIADTQLAMQNIGAASKDISGVAQSVNGTINGDGKQAIRDIAEASQAIKQAAQSTQSMVGKLEGPAGDFASTALPQLTAAIVTLQQAAESLDRLTNEIERDPRSVIGKGPAMEMELKP